MKLPRFRIACPVLLASLLAASGCSNTVLVRKPIFPPSADLVAATEAKPAPTDEILISEAAAARYDADVELWGERLHGAGVRICRWARDSGMKIQCP